MKANTYNQAVLKGVVVIFPQTKDIIENGITSDIKPTDVQKNLYLKHAWEFILNKDVLNYDTDYYILSHIPKLVNEFYSDCGRIRDVLVAIGGTSYIPPLTIESIVKKNIDAVSHESANAVGPLNCACTV